MIRCLCKENVQDKFTGENYVAGREYKFTRERAEEVTKTRYFEYAQEEGYKVKVDDVDSYKEGAIEKVAKEITKETKPKKPGKKSAK